MFLLHGIHFTLEVTSHAFDYLSELQLLAMAEPVFPRHEGVNPVGGGSTSIDHLDHFFFQNCVKWKTVGHGGTA